MVLNAFRAATLQFWMLCSFLFATILLGGSSRANVVSLIILRPLSVIAVGLALWTMRKDDLREYRWLLTFFAALMVLPLLQLIPLPPEIWQSLPGRSLIVDLDKAAGLDNVWRPLTMAPDETWNAWYSLFAPLAAALWLSQLGDSERTRLLPVLIALILISAGIGLLQAIGLPLKLYALSNPSAGLFANRNHQAIVLSCLLLLLGTYAFRWRAPRKLVRTRLMIAGSAAVLLVPLIVITGSRAGMVTLGLALLGLPILYWISHGYRIPKHERRLFAGAVLAGMLSIVALIGAIVLLAREGALSRFTSSSLADDLRFPLWATVSSLVEVYALLGSGFGSFVQVFKVWEPNNLLGPQYWNHAHNDWLELSMTGGIPAIALLVFMIGIIFISAKKTFRTTKDYRASICGAALGMLLIFALASIVDYPLRTPSAQCLAVVAIFWTFPPRRKPLTESDQPNCRLTEAGESLHV